jgi:hypothetical protein
MLHRVARMLHRFHLQIENGAGDRSRTDDFDLGKVALYQLSYTRPESLNCDRENNFLQPSLRILARCEGCTKRCHFAHDLRRVRLNKLRSDG